jgi:hypothetical protein
VPTLPTPTTFRAKSSSRQVELLEQLAPIVVERYAIDPDHLPQLVHPLLLCITFQEYPERHDQGRLIDDLGLAVDLLREL